jgi:hypothetical protein
MHIEASFHEQSLTIPFRKVRGIQKILGPILLGHEGEIRRYEGEGIDHQKAGTAGV